MISRRSALAALLTLPAVGTCRPSSVVQAPPNAPRRGPPDGPLVQEVGDYECPFCAEVQPAVSQLLAAYGERIVFVWRNYPLARHPHAQLAAEAALEVRAQLGDDGFWKYHEVLLGNQHALERQQLQDYSEALGVDQGRFLRALELRVHRRSVESDKRSIQALEIPSFGTPAFLIEEDAFVGVYTFEQLAELVADKL